jgi:hypothetical protein
MQLPHLPVTLSMVLQPRRSARELAGALVVIVLSSPDASESADRFAHRVGLRNRHQLNRVLHHGSFPSYRVLASFSRVHALRDRAEANHGSLCAEVLVTGMQPGWVYRTVRRVTGRRWSTIWHLSHNDLLRLVVHS